jgi:hypothetical protein
MSINVDNCDYQKNQITSFDLYNHGYQILDCYIYLSVSKKLNQFFA